MALACLLAGACSSGSVRAQPADTSMVPVPPVIDEGTQVRQLPIGLLIGQAPEPDDDDDETVDDAVLGRLLDDEWPVLVPRGLPLPLEPSGTAVELEHSDGTGEFILDIDLDRSARVSGRSYLEAAAAEGWRAESADVAAPFGRTVVVSVREPWSGSVVITDTEEGGSTLSAFITMGVETPLAAPATTPPTVEPAAVSDSP